MQFDNFELMPKIKESLTVTKAYPYFKGFRAGSRKTLNLKSLAKIV